MGNNSSDLTEAKFKQHWRVSSQINGRNVWENKQNHSQKVDEYNINDDEIENNERLANLRKFNAFVVNAYSFKKQGFSCQMDHSSKKIYVEHTPLRLSNLKKVPYPDVFHLYDIFIHGYPQLTKVVGFFNVELDQVGINERGGAKVWLSNNFESNRMTGVKITQTKMVTDMLALLQSITDHSSSGQYPNIANYFKKPENTTFTAVTSAFRQYINDSSGGEVPTRLTILSNTSNLQTPRVQESSFTGNSVNVQPKAPVNPPVTIAETETKVSQPYQSNVFVPTGTQKTIKNELISSVSKPLVSETFIGNPVVQLPTYPRPTTSGNLVRTNSQDFNQFKPRPGTLNSQIRFAHSNNVVAISPVPQQPQQPQQNIQLIYPRPVFQQHVPQSPQVVTQYPQVVTQYPQVVSQYPQAASQYPQVATQVVSQVPQNIQQSQQSGSQFNTISSAQNTVLTNATPVISQTSIPTSNQQTRALPLQVSATQNILQNLKGLQVVQNKGDFVTTSYPSSYGQFDNRLQQKAVSQAYETKDAIKVAESAVQNVSAGSVNKTTALKGSQTIAWEDYTNKNEASKGLSNFGRAVPQSFDVTTQKKTQTQFNNNKFTPESDGKSSAEFLALLSQIKSGIGQNSSISQSSYTTSKNQGGQGTYNGSSYQSSKFTSNNYVSSNYQGGLDPELHADLQKYRQ